MGSGEWGVRMFYILQIISKRVSLRNFVVYKISDVYKQASTIN